MIPLRQLRLSPAAFLAAVLLLSGAGRAPAQTPGTQGDAGSPSARGRAVYNQAIAAMGGDLYLQARYRSANGRAYGFSSTGELNNTGTPFWIFTRFPDAERIEEGKKRDVIEIISGDKGWEITYKGVAPMLLTLLNEALVMRSHSLDVVLKQWAADPITLIMYQGLNDVDGAQVDSVGFYHGDKDMVTVDFAIDTHLPLRLSWRRDDPLTGGHFDQIVIYGNWRAIGGIATAMDTSVFQGTRKISQQYLDDASYAPVPDAMFEPKPLKH